MAIFENVEEEEIVVHDDWDVWCFRGQTTTWIIQTCVRVLDELDFFKNCFRVSKLKLVQNGWKEKVWGAKRARYYLWKREGAKWVLCYPWTKMRVISANLSISARNVPKPKERKEKKSICRWSIESASSCERSFQSLASAEPRSSTVGGPRLRMRTTVGGVPFRENKMQFAFMCARVSEMADAPFAVRKQEPWRERKRASARARARGEVMEERRAGEVCER